MAPQFRDTVRFLPPTPDHNRIASCTSTGINPAQVRDTVFMPRTP
jgi:hypothetical protein